MKDDIYIKYLRQYYDKHGTINDIGYDAVDVFEGKNIAIGHFLSQIRNSHKKYIESNGTIRPTSLILTRYKKLELMGFSWEKSQFKKATGAMDEPAIKFLIKHYDEYGTINDFDYEDEVEFEGQNIKIGKYLSNISHLHFEYQKGSKHNNCASPINRTRYSILDDMDFEWNSEKRKAIRVVETDIITRYLRYHYKKNGTINDITTSSVVEFDGQTVRIGAFIERIRAKHKSYLTNPTDSFGSSEISKERYRILDEMNFIWNKSIQTDSDPYIEYLKYHYEKNGTINDIKTREIVEYNGQQLEIGNFLARMRSKYTKKITSEQLIGESELTKRRQEILTELGFEWEKEKEVSITEIAKENKLNRRTFTKMVKMFGGNITKAIAISKALQRAKKDKVSNPPEDYQISSLFKDFKIEFESFIKCLLRDSLRTEVKDEPLIYEGSMSLKEFCIQNGYNYKLISKAVRLKKDGLCDESFESLINRCLIEDKIKDENYVSTWIYSKYGNVELIKYLLSSNGLDSKKILSNMGRNAISLDKALEYEVFRKNTCSENSYLEGVYHDFVSFYRAIFNSNEYTSDTILPILDEYKKTLATNYNLTDEEITIVTTSFNEYKNIIHQYRLFDVGFEKDENKRVDKIISYGFEQSDIEDAFFMPLKFEKRNLYGRNRELYNRRLTLMNLTLSWNHLTPEERTSAAARHNLKYEEMHYIKTNSQELAGLKEKVYQKK